MADMWRSHMWRYLINMSRILNSEHHYLRVNTGQSVALQLHSVKSCNGFRVCIHNFPNASLLYTYFCARIGIEIVAPHHSLRDWHLYLDVHCSCAGTHTHAHACTHARTHRYIHTINKQSRYTEFMGRCSTFSSPCYFFSDSLLDWWIGVLR